MPNLIDPTYELSHPADSEEEPVRYLGALGEGTQYYQLIDEDEDYILELIKLYLDSLGCSIGASQSSTLIYQSLTITLVGYRIETAYDWGKLLHSTNEHEQRFIELADEWRGSQGVTSNLTQIAMNSAYQQIIGMGELAVPFIFRELEKEPDHWFWALKSITGVDPVSEKNRGNIRQMAAEWLEWGKKKGYQW